jgi:hypothetical protein
MNKTTLKAPFVRQYCFEIVLLSMSGISNELLKIFDKTLKKDIKIAIRLNGTSDIDHLDLLERYTGINFLDPFYSSLLFYDYTKNYNHIKRYLMPLIQTKDDITKTLTLLNWLLRI